jgi:hypothetical protein
MLSNERFKFSDKEIIEKGSRVLIKELGYSGFLRYIRNFEDGYGEDYLKVQDDIYKDMSLDDIFKRASDTWRKENIKKTI